MLHGQNEVGARPFAGTFGPCPDSRTSKLTLTSRQVDAERQVYGSIMG